MLMFICPSCARGADTAAAAAADPTASPSLRRVRDRNVAAAHAVCRGGTWCSCQHRQGR
jgi:hypothetical protein